jgi:hypothetical protein
MRFPRLGRLLSVLVLSLAGASPCLEFQGRVLLPSGDPVAGARVSIVGLPASVRADQAGRFLWQPDPALPFEVLVLLPSGQAMPPIRVDALPESGVIDLQVQPALIETVTVTPGAAPHIEAPPGGGFDTLAREDLDQRHTVHLADIIENLPGAGDLEEGHSVVPSLRGLARGRTLILLDGARVTAERRAGPSATYLDPIFLESVDVSRGPGSVAYGSDALGGVIAAQTRLPAPGSPLRFRVQGTLGEGIPERAAGAEMEGGIGRGGWLVSARVREFDPYRSPEGEVFDSAAEDYGFLARWGQPVGNGFLSVGLQSDRGRDIG